MNTMLLATVPITLVRSFPVPFIAIQYQVLLANSFATQTDTRAHTHTHTHTRPVICFQVHTHCYIKIAYSYIAYFNPGVGGPGIATELRAGRSGIESR